MEEMEPVQSSNGRVERRRKSIHSSKPYERDSKRRATSSVEQQEETQTETGLFGGLRTLLKKFTYTPPATRKLQRQTDSESHSDYESDEERLHMNGKSGRRSAMQIKDHPTEPTTQQDTLSMDNSLVTSSGDSIARAIDQRTNEISRVEYDYYLKLLQDRLPSVEREKLALKSQFTAATLPSNVVRPSAHHAPNATTPSDVLRTFFHGKLPERSPSTSSFAESPSVGLKQPKRIRSPASPEPNGQPYFPPETISKPDEEKEIYLDRQPPPSKRIKQYQKFGASEAAMRIMATLDQMSSPLEDARASRMSTSTILGSRALTAGRSTPSSDSLSRKIEKPAMRGPKPTPRPATAYKSEEDEPPVNFLSVPNEKPKKVEKKKELPISVDRVKKKHQEIEPEEPEDEEEDSYLDISDEEEPPKKKGPAKPQKRTIKKDKKLVKKSLVEEAVISLDDEEDETYIAPTKTEPSTFPTFIPQTQNFFNNHDITEQAQSSSDEELLRKKPTKDLEKKEAFKAFTGPEKEKEFTGFNSMGASAGISLAIDKEEKKDEKKEDKSVFSFGIPAPTAFTFNVDKQEEKKIIQKEEKQEEKSFTSVFNFNATPTPASSEQKAKKKKRDSSDEEPSVPFKLPFGTTPISFAPIPYNNKFSVLDDTDEVDEKEDKEEKKEEQKTAAPPLAGFNVAIPDTIKELVEKKEAQKDVQEKKEEKKEPAVSTFASFGAPTIPFSSSTLPFGTSVTAPTTLSLPVSGFTLGSTEDKKTEKKEEAITEPKKEEPTTAQSVIKMPELPSFNAPTTPTAASTPAAPSFSFGAASSFSFGAPTPAAEPEKKTELSITPSSNGFQFGGLNTQSATGFSFETPTAPTASSTSNDFVFGGVTTQSATTSFGASVTTPSTGFSFAPATTAAPAFGAASTPAVSFGSSTPTTSFGALSTSAPAFGSTPSPSTGFAFGASSTPGTFGSASAPSSSTGFAFGASSTPSTGFSFEPSSSPTSFGNPTTPPFGAASSAPFGAATSAGFAFGATSTPAATFGSTPPQTDFSFGQGSTTPSFTFGASQAQLNPGFGFAAAPFGTTPETPGFASPNLGGDPGNVGGFSIGASGVDKNRKIVKGKRRSGK